MTEQKNRKRRVKINEWFDENEINYEFLKQI